MAEYAIDQWSEALRTTDTSPTNLVSFRLPQNASVNLRVFVLARSASGLTKVWQIGCGVKRLTGSPPERIGNRQYLMPPQGELGTELWDVDVLGIGNQVRVVVVGGLEIIEWYGEIHTLVIVD